MPGKRHQGDTEAEQRRKHEADESYEYGDAQSLQDDGEYLREYVIGSNDKSQRRRDEDQGDQPPGIIALLGRSVG